MTATETVTVAVTVTVTETVAETVTETVTETEYVSRGVNAQHPSFNNLEELNVGRETLGTVYLFSASPVCPRSRCSSSPATCKRYHRQD